MVEKTIAARGIVDEAVLQAMRSVPRHEFVPAHLKHSAYDDSPLPIGGEQTISQPYIVARMAQALMLKPQDKVLEVGTGSGYAAAVFSHLAAEVHTIERIASLADGAAEVLKRLGYGNVFVHKGDGTRGLPEHSPYDAIAVAAAASNIPEPLVLQLAEGGRLVIPVGTPEAQRLWRIIRGPGNKIWREELTDVRFVPLVSAG
jgi:protein-L-isoaspartate(D-aspartate) O-methyltransferase